MTKKKKKDFSETSPFKRSAFLKAKIWNPLSLFKSKEIFPGILLLITGIFYFFWSLVKKDLYNYYVFIFLLPGTLLCLKALQKKRN